MAKNIGKAQLTKILVSVGGVCMIAFGVWHFFVPAQWDWYSYIDPEATELVAAVRAVNAFFSLCLVLIGAADLLLVFFPTDRFSQIVMLSVTTVLWTVRVIFQIVYPQGSLNPFLQYGLLTAFAAIFICFGVSLWLVTAQTEKPIK